MKTFVKIIIALAGIAAACLAAICLLEECSSPEYISVYEDEECA